MRFVILYYNSNNNNSQDRPGNGKNLTTHVNDKFFFVSIVVVVESGYKKYKTFF